MEPTIEKPNSIFEALEMFYTTLRTIKELGTSAIINNDPQALADLYRKAGESFILAAENNERAVRERERHDT